MGEIYKVKNIEEANILRGMLCVFVLIIHTTANPSIELEPMSISSIIFSVLNIATKVAVPGFIFLSGLTISYGYRNRAIGKVSKFYIKRFYSVCIPYMVWTLVYYVAYIILYNYEISLSFLINKLINGSMSYHLYFLVILIQLYALYPGLLYMFKKYNNNALLVISIVLNLLVYNFSTSSIFFGKYIAFFVCGIYMGINYDRVIKVFTNKRNRKIILSIGVLATIYYIIEEYLYRHTGILINKSSTTWYVFSLLCIPMYYILAIDICDLKGIFDEKVSSILNDISKVSFSIYLVHPLIIIILDKLLNRFTTSWKYMIMTIVLLLISICYAKFMVSINNRRVGAMNQK